MALLETACRLYQSLFSNSSPEEARLVELHSSGRQDQFCREYFDHEFRKGQDVVNRFSLLAPNWQRGKILDFGCGAGGLTCQMAKRCDEAVGIDLEQYKIDYAVSEAGSLNLRNIQFICYDGESLPFSDASFDCVFCVDVIEHLPTPENFVAEFLRVLKPGGLLLLSFGPPWGHAHGKHMWAKLPGWWTHLIFPRHVNMRVAGFPPETTWEQLGMFKLTVSKFERCMRLSGFEQRYYDKSIKKILLPLKHVPLLRELFIGEVIGVFVKPG